MRIPPPASLLLLPALAACTAPAPEEEGGRARLVWRLPGEPASLDPARASGSRPQAIVRRTHEGLVVPDPRTGAPVPGLAERWSVGEDGRRYVFHLRRGVRFHDGGELSADDVVYSLDRLLDPATGSALAGPLRAVVGGAARLEGRADQVEGITALDRHTVEIRLQRPFGPFLGLLSMAQAAILPAAVPVPGDGRVPGTGPFRLTAWERGRSLTLGAFEGHRRGPPRLDEVVFQVVSDPATALAAYEAGDLDVLDAVPPGRRAAMARARPGEYRTAPIYALFGLGFNHERSPLAANLALRRALAHAIDRDYICRVLLQGKDRPALQILPPGVPGRVPEGTGHPFDLDRARRYLAQAGHPGGRGLRPLRAAYPETNLSARDLLERYRADLGQVGVRLEPVPLDAGVLDEKLVRGGEAMSDIDLFRFGWLADYPDPDALFTPLLASSAVGGGVNAGYRDAELDRLLERARAASDPEGRAALYRSAMVRAHQRVALIPMYWFSEELMVRPGVEGILLGPLGEPAIPLDRVTVAPRR